MTKPADLNRYATEIAELKQIGQSFSQRNWTRAGSCSYSLVVQSEPQQILITTGSACRDKLSDTDFAVLDAGLGSQDEANLLGRDTAVHGWLVEHQQAVAIVQTQSVWCNLLAERFLALDGVLLESHELLRRIANNGQPAQPRWIPIALHQPDLMRQLNNIDKAFAETPVEFSHCPPLALIIQRDSLLTWAQSLEQAVLQAETLEYCCELLVRRAQLG